MPHVHEVAAPQHQRERWVGRRVVEADGTRIGTVVDIYADPQGPTWALVRERRFGGWRRVVPIDAARSSAVGIVVPYTRATVRGAPVIERGHPSPQEGQRLTAHYDGRDATVAAPASAAESAADADAVAQAVAEARHRGQKLSLYRARIYRGDPTSERRLRELERDAEGAQAQLRRVRQAGSSAGRPDAPEGR